MRDTRYVWSKCKSYNIIIIIGSQSPSALTRDLLLDRYRRTLWAQIMYIMIQWRVMHFWYNFVWIVHSLFTAPFKFKKFNVRWAVHHDALSFGCCGGLQADWETVSSHGHYMSKGDFRKRGKKKKDVEKWVTHEEKRSVWASPTTNTLLRCSVFSEAVGIYQLGSGPEGDGLV